MIGALIVSAGVGKRMGGDQPKQFLQLAGRSILTHTVGVFSGMEEFSTIQVGVAPGFTDRARQEIFSHLPSDERIRFFDGGPHRQDTVRLGLEQVAPETEWLVIHDAVRPLVAAELIRSVIRAAREDVGAICAIPVADTLKRVNASGHVEETVSREGIWTAQTPQAFRRDVLLDVHRRAEREGIRVTDDAALLERFGYKVRVVIGAPENIKITTPGDLSLAEFYLSHPEGRVP